MSTDSQGRPLSDDGQWAWNGTEWVPAASGPAEPEAAAGAEAEDVGATRIVQSPFPGGVPGAAAPVAAAPGDAPSYGSAQTEVGPAQGYGQAPGYAPAPEYGPGPGYGPGAPGAVGSAGGYGVPPQPKGNSRKRLIIAVIGVLIIAAVVVVLILTLGSSKSSKASGLYNCKVVGQTSHGTITLGAGSTYTVSGGSPGGTVTAKGSKLTFNGGSFGGATAVVSNGGKHVVISIQGSTIDCTK